MNVWIGIRRVVGTCAVTTALLNIPAIGVSAAPQLEEPSVSLSQLREKDPEARKSAVQRLAKMRERRAVEPLIEILVHDPEKEVRRSAAYALGLLQDPRAVEPLMASLKEEDPDLCINAVFALAGMKAEGKEDVRAAALTAALAHQNVHVCQAAAIGLALLGNRNAVDSLSRLLHDERFTVRSGAAFALGFLSDRRAVPALLDALQDDRPDMRRIVVASLGLLRDSRALPALMRLAVEDPDPEVRSRTSEVLRSLSPKTDK